MGLLTPVEQQTKQAFGMVPMEERLSLLPRYSGSQGLIAPQFIYDLAKAISAPIVAMRGQQVSPEEALNVAISTFGGSAAGVAPKGSVRSGLQRTSKESNKTEFEIANEIAQKNATEMLGLPANNTAMDRAKALGYDTPAFHGTNRNFKEFSNEMLGATTGAKSAQKAHFLASNPELSNTYVSTRGIYNSSPPAYEKLVKNKKAFEEFNAAPDAQSQWMVLEKYGMNYGSGQVMPLLAKLGNPKIKDYKSVGYRDETFNDLIKSAKKSKKDSVVFKNTFDPGPYEGQNVQSDVYAVFNPANIRSRFAAFDPARVNEANLLAMGGSPLPLGLLVGDRKENKPKK
jgi:hypothetical protein